MSENGNGRPPGELLVRDATLVGVSYPKREIEMIVMPYEQEALVGRDGRMVKEIVSRGAFDGIEHRPNRVRVNRDHNLERTVGRAVAFHPSREEGLVSVVRIAKTVLGEETLALAEDDMLDASAGFLPYANGGEKWETRSRVRILKGWLGHIALTPEPAYDGARVLAVRSEPPRILRDAVDAVLAEPEFAATPNLDQVRAWLLQKRYAEFDR